ncbi:MAG: hypothetical protein H7308_17225 [Chthonomonadaceae bacterium]|nr:hypothetical protein [Chthonomonadaceae bacterium]
MKILLILVSAIAGAILLSLLTFLFHWLCFRPALSDGQYALVFFVTIPFGAVLGTLSSLVRLFLSRGKTDIARRVAVSSGGFLTILFILLGFFVLSGTQNPSFLERVGATMFWFGVPLFWSGILTAIGLRIQNKS